MPRTFGLVAAAIVLSSVAASAQLKITFGVSAGFNLSRLTSAFRGGFTTAYYSTRSLAGYSAGAFALLKVTSALDLEPEFNYSLRGGRSYSDGVTGVLRSSYLCLPVLARYHFKKFDRFFFQLGPEVDLLLASQRTVTDGVESHSGTVKSSYKSFDAGFTFGEGYFITPRFLFDLRSFIGIANIDRVIEPNTRLRNVSAQLTLHYKFR